MRISLFGLSILFAGCAVSSPVPPESRQQSEALTQQIPTTSGKFIGQYGVPVSPDLADAAIFAVPEVDWSVSGGKATLRYDLPIGLVGGSLSVTLSGPIASGATTVQLTSSVGSGSCTASGSVITCNEAFVNLGTLPISEAVVEQVATTDYAGPVADRVAVAAAFSSDPIGTVAFDVTVPSLDGDGGGGGGGGGGHDGRH